MERTNVKVAAPLVRKGPGVGHISETSDEELAGVRTRGSRVLLRSSSGGGRAPGPHAGGLALRHADFCPHSRQRPERLLAPLPRSWFAPSPPPPPRQHQPPRGLPCPGPARPWAGSDTP